MPIEDTEASASRAANTARQPAGPPASNAGGTGAAVSEARAQAIALEAAGLTQSQVDYFSIHLDRDDGRTVYEIEFRQGRMEYECEIDAATGAILEWDAEYD